MGGSDMGGLKLYGACNGGPGIVRNVSNPARNYSDQNLPFQPEKSLPKILGNLCRVKIR